MKKINIPATLTTFALSTASYGAIVISEFEPNPAGTDPATTTVEISGGVGNAAYDLWFISIESDPTSIGTIDRAENVTGNFDANGFATFGVPDLENPSFTVALIESTEPIVAGTDLDPSDAQTLSIPSAWTVLDALGVPDLSGDEAITGAYASALGGVGIAYNGEFEPLSVFRDGTTGNWFNTVTVNFGTPEERVAIFDAAGVEVSGSSFDIDPSTNVTTFGTVNPSLIPEPSVALLGGLGLLGMLRRRR
jgi:hypothetical protein